MGSYLSTNTRSNLHCSVSAFIIKISIRKHECRQPLKTSPFEDISPTENPYTPNTVTNIRGGIRDGVGEKNIKWLYEFQYGTQCRLFIQWARGGVRDEREPCGNMGDWFDIDFLAELGGGG